MFFDLFIKQLLMFIKRKDSPHFMILKDASIEVT